MKYFKPKSLTEALDLLSDEKTRFEILAGGTDLIVQWRSSPIKPNGMIDINQVEELKNIVETDEYIEIGALCTHRMIAQSKIVQIHLTPLSDACRSVGAIQIQNRGTIGGNIANASPAGDLPPALVVYNCELELSSIYGRRWLRLRDFFLDYRKIDKAPEEMITRFRIPLPIEYTDVKFYKIGTRKAQAVSKAAICFGATLRLSSGQAHEKIIEKISIAAASMGPTVVTASKTEGLLTENEIDEDLIRDAGRSLANEFHPIDDIRSTAKYRSTVCGNLLVRFLKNL